jgi:hypothetical protein
LERLKIEDEPLDGSETALTLAIDAEQPPPVAALASLWQGIDDIGIRPERSRSLSD